MKRLAAMAAAAAVAALLGCGGGATAPGASTAADVKARTLARIQTLEGQVESGTVTARDVQALVQSLRYLVGHARAQKVGTEEQVAAIEQVAVQLAGQSAPARPPADWKPGEDAPPDAGAVVDTASLKDLLPRIRQAVEALP